MSNQKNEQSDLHKMRHSAAHVLAQAVYPNAKLGIDPSIDKRINAKIRKAQLMKVPYMLIVGDKEVENGSVSVRQRDGVKEANVRLKDFMARIQKRISDRSKVL